MWMPRDQRRILAPPSGCGRFSATGGCVRPQARTHLTPVYLLSGFQPVTRGILACNMHYIYFFCTKYIDHPSRCRYSTRRRVCGVQNIGSSAVNGGVMRFTSSRCANRYLHLLHHPSKAGKLRTVERQGMSEYQCEAPKPNVKYIIIFSAGCW